MNILYIPIFFFFVVTVLFQGNISFISAYTLAHSLPIKDGQFLISQSETFKLGFFSPANRTNRYVGIWYNKIPVQTVVWVANRESPLSDLSGVLMISSMGSLVIQNRENHTIWWTKTPETVGNPIVELLESGNLVLRESNSDGYLWQSFDYPSDTLLPGMKLGWNLKTGLNRNLTSWKSFDDPSPGDYTHGIDLNGGYPELVMRNGSKKYYSGGPWNGIRFGGVPDLKEGGAFKYDFVQNENEGYSIYHLPDQSIFAIVVNQSGISEASAWMNETKSWYALVSFPKDPCDSYDQCGANSFCQPSYGSICRCLDGFEPISPNDWNWSQGCQRMTPSECDNGFQKFTEVKVPDTTRTWVNASMNLEECRGKCSKNCSCMAYTNLDIRGSGSGCAMWVGDLIDIRRLSYGAGQDLYIRVPASELGDSRKKKSVIMIVSITLAGVTLVLSCWGCCYISKKKKAWQIFDKIKSKGDGKKDDFELPLFDLVTISAATNNFSEENKLGQGGYGPVFKGKLAEGQQIAAKRLSKKSLQGPDEFKNEILLISKLQHRNLVRLLGCCIQGEEKMLIYEYMPNRSLDYYIFGTIRSEVLDWQKRFHIIMGIARGLLYLHQDSRMRIIHRDLKTSNILLDSDMTPKISDFGLARIFGRDQLEANTHTVVGTHGYMSPEYAGYGRFSIKSDVFSFGVIVLEIVSGKKNRGFHHTDHHLNLLGHAWRLWSEGKALDSVDESMGNSFLVREVLRCIHTGLLCVQQGSQQRPTMSSVVTMLSSEEMVLPQPEPPGFYVDGSPVEFNTSVSDKEPYSDTLEGR